MQLVEQKTGGETGDTGADDGDLFLHEGRPFETSVRPRRSQSPVGRSAEQAQQPDEATGKVDLVATGGKPAMMAREASSTVTRQGMGKSFLR
jgi:hypothetical protein